MTYSKTKRVSKYAAIAWLCLLAFVVIVRAANLPLGNVKPEAVALTFIMTLPFTLGLRPVWSSAPPGPWSAGAVSARQGPARQAEAGVGSEDP